MKYPLLVLTFLLLFGSCKLMKKDEPQKPVVTVMNNRFKPVEWAHTTNIYEVNVRQYTAEGTFNAFAKELPRLKAMGVQTLWFMPVTPISRKNMKGSMGSYYACSDYTSINPEFGTMDDFKTLVKQAQASGFKVIIDWVANHTGWEHVWTKEHPEYYLKDSVTNDFHIASGMDDIVELDFSNPALRKAMIDAMKFWVTECNIDGFRCDLASWVELDFWKEARPQVDAVKPLFWLGEFDELETPGYGEAFDASYSWTWMHKTKNFYEEKWPVDSLITLLKQYSKLGDTTMRSWFTSNHDENSWNGTEYEKYGGMAKALAVFSATWNGIPLIYSGQELPNRKRIKFFDKDAIDWNGPVQLNDFYKALLELKSSSSALRAGDPAVQTIQLNTGEGNKVLGYMRQNGSSKVLVLLNLSPDASSFTLSDSVLTGNYIDIFSGQTRKLAIPETILLKPWEYLVMREN